MTTLCHFVINFISLQLTFLISKVESRKPQQGYLLLFLFFFFLLSAMSICYALWMIFLLCYIEMFGCFWVINLSVVMTLIA